MHSLDLSLRYAPDRSPATSPSQGGPPLQVPSVRRQLSLPCSPPPRQAVLGVAELGQRGCELCKQTQYQILPEQEFWVRAANCGVWCVQMSRIYVSVYVLLLVSVCVCVCARVHARVCVWWGFEAMCFGGLVKVYKDPHFCAQ